MEDRSEGVSGDGVGGRDHADTHTRFFGWEADSASILFVPCVPGGDNGGLTHSEAAVQAEREGFAVGYDGMILDVE